MIYIFYTRSVARLKAESFNFFFRQLSTPLQNKLLRFRNWQDAQRSLLGKALLLNGLQFLGLSRYSLSDLKFTDLQKPYFDSSIDFNIAHSGEYIICAISLTNKIGVDVEEIKSIPLDDFTNNFSEREWQEILKKENDFYGFYKYWTQKEAFLKAIGTGLYVPLKEAEIIDNKITWKNKEWFLKEIKLDKGYISHVSSDSLAPGLMLEQITYN